MKFLSYTAEESNSQFSFKAHTKVEEDKSFKEKTDVKQF